MKEITTRPLTAEEKKEFELTEEQAVYWYVELPSGDVVQVVGHKTAFDSLAPRSPED